MIDSYRWAQGRSLASVVLLALSALVSILLLLSSPRGAYAQTSPTADYRFQDTRSSSVGTAPALVDICDVSPEGPCTGANANTFTTATVDGASRKVLSFPQGNGLKLSPTTGVVFNGAYTIEVQVEFDSVNGYQRILDFKHGTSDNGLYVDDGNLEFFRTGSASGTGAPITANQYVKVTLSRNSSGTVAGYVDGELQFFFSDTSNDAVIDTNNVLRFFRDNESGGATGEDAAGSVTRIRLYNEALPTTFTVNSTGDQNDLDFPSGSWNQSGDGRCDVDAVAAGSQCTLRAAIQQSDLAGGADTINFNIPGTGLHTISPSSALPPVYGGATIDGYSQPGASPNTLAVGNNAAPKIELRGANAGTTGEDKSGIRLTGWNNVVRGLIINGWAKNGIEVTRANNNAIEGNFIGTDVSGTQVAQPRNGGYGVWLHGASDNVVGGTTPAARNVISGSGVQGVYISRYIDANTNPRTDVDASGNEIQGNYIGTDKNGTTALGNGANGYQTANGVWIDGASHNAVGGTVAGAGNLISGNAGSGVQIGSGVADAQANPFTIDGPSYNTVQGNYIGTDASGTWDLGNGGIGVDITENNFSSFVAGHNVIGGATPAARNVIACNSGGVDISFDHQRNNQVMGNYIGTDASGTLDRGNDSWGVSIFGSLDNVVGGTDAGTGNLISGNDGPGVLLGTPGGSTMFPTGNRILRNSIFDNDKRSFDDRELGIDLEGGTQSPEGVTQNDTGDPDTGPNNLQNYPVITSAVTSGGHTTIKGTINTTANDRLTVQLFSSSAADPSGYGEGETYIGDVSEGGDDFVDTDPQGNATFSYVTSKPLAAGQVVTATATSTFTRGTSEFSKAVAVNTAPTVTNLKPASGSRIRDRTPLVAATVSDAQTDLDKSNIKLFVDGKSKGTFSYDASTDRLSYTSGRLSFAKHTVKIVATDGVLSTTKSWSFKVV